MLWEKWLWKSSVARPKHMEIEFNLGLSAQAGVWIIGAKTE
jgi:hypothetical protein